MCYISLPFQGKPGSHVGTHPGVLSSRLPGRASGALNWLVAVIKQPLPVMTLGQFLPAYDSATYRSSSGVLLAPRHGVPGAASSGPLHHLLPPDTLGCVSFSTNIKKPTGSSWVTTLAPEPYTMIPR